MKLGTLDINKAYLGSTEIVKAYLGSNLIFDNTQPGPTPTTKTFLQCKSSGDYVQANNLFDLTSASTWEIQFKINTGTSPADKYVIGSSNHAYFPDFSFHTVNYTRVLIPTTSGGSWQEVKVGSVFQTITNYFVKYGYNNGSYYCKYSTDDGATWIDNFVPFTGSACDSSAYMRIGADAWNLSYFFNGVIELSAVKVYANNSLVFDGSDSTQYTVYGSPDITTSSVDDWGIFGNPTVTDGIVSGFSATNYVRYFGQVGTTRETNLFIKTPSSFSDQYLLGNLNTSQVLRFNSKSGGSYALIYAVYGGTTFNGVTQLQPNTDYIFKLISNANSNETDMYTIVNNGYTKDTLPSLSNWTLEWHSTNSAWFRELLIGSVGNGLDFTGTVDLNNSCVI